MWQPFFIAATLDTSMKIEFGSIVTGSADPVTTSELKSHLRIDLDDEDTDLGYYITTARQIFEDKTKIQLGYRTMYLYVDYWQSFYWLPRHPLASVTSIAYLDTAGDSQTVSSSLYTVDTKHKPGLVTFKEAFTYPSLCEDCANRITVTYVAGYATSSLVPEQWKTAIKLLAGHFYNNRETAIEKQLHNLPYGFETICNNAACNYWSEQ